MGLSDWYKRLRHSRGYGVHSPYAFSMVLETLHAPRGCCYYAEEAIADPHLRLIFRIIVALQPSDIIVSANPERTVLIQELARRALPHCKPDSALAPHTLVIAEGPMPDAPADGASILTDTPTDPALLRHIAAHPYGQLYANPRRALFAALPHLPSQTIRVNF
ncbi:MAG: hypothetical protein K2M61_07055 [Muribaculaceae bacterium]|nr:hypothetical protein [Muribaculaceae bacterium]